MFKRALGRRVAGANPRDVVGAMRSDELPDIWKKNQLWFGIAFGFDEPIKP